LVLGDVAEVNQVDINHVKDVIIGFAHILDIYVSIDEQIVEFEIVVNEASAMYLLKNIHELNSKGAYLFFCKLSISFFENLVKVLSKTWHYDVYEDP